MPLRNTPMAYGAVAKALHWTIALLIAGLFVLGWAMSDLFDGDRATQFRLYQLHKSFGLTVLALVVVRVLWRLANPPPPLPAHMAGWERGAALGAHLALYALMIAVPVAGWIAVSAAGLPIGSIFGVIPIPDLSDHDEALMHQAGEIHETLVWLVLLPVVILHVLAALKHHIVDKDDVMRRMLPGRAPRTSARRA